MAAKIAVVGSMNMDLVARAHHIPEPGETIVGRDFRMVPGGKGANQAVAAARLGAKVMMVGRVGNDPFAAQLLQNLDKDGIDHRFVFQDIEEATGVALIMVDESGQNSILVAAGANYRLSVQDIESARSAIEEADVLLVQLENPVNTILRAVQIGHAAGVIVILNPAPARPVPEELLSLADFVIPNEPETTMMTGLPVNELNQAGIAAARLVEMGARQVIITLGKRGCYFCNQTTSKYFQAFRVNAIDTTAAGDAFLGGFAVALAENQPIEYAIKWGRASGALAATRMGAQPSLPNREEVLQLISNQMID